MTVTAQALLTYIAWSVFLVALLGFYRTGLVLTGRRAANAFSPSGHDVGDFGQRITRAHANCYENLPAAGAVMLYAIATQQTIVTDPLALIFIGARLAQSIVHLASTSRPAVLARFGFFLVQLAILIWWIVSLSGVI